MTPPIVTPVPLIPLCAWHTPAAELAAINLKYPGQVTHTICAACAILFEQATA